MIPNVLNPWNVNPEDLEADRRDTVTRELISGLVRGEFSLVRPEPDEDPQWIQRCAEAAHAARVLGAGSRGRRQAASILCAAGATLKELHGAVQLRDLGGAQPWKVLNIELLKFTSDAVSPWATDGRLLSLMWRAAGPEVRAAARADAFNAPLMSCLRPRRRHRSARQTT